MNTRPAIVRQNCISIFSYNFSSLTYFDHLQNFPLESCESVVFTSAIQKFQFLSRIKSGTLSSMLLSNKEKQPVPFLKLFKFASYIELLQVTIAIITSLLNGVCLPIQLIVWSDLANVLVYEVSASNWNGKTMESLSNYQNHYKENW